MAAILIDVGNGKPLRVELEGDRLTVGRRQGNDLRLPHPSVSGKHAAFVRAGAGWVLEDLGSRNGIVVNGRRAPRRRLRDGDVLVIGVHRIVFQGDEAETTKTQAADKPAAPVARGRRGADARTDVKASDGAGARVRVEASPRAEEGAGAAAAANAVAWRAEAPVPVPAVTTGSSALFVPRLPPAVLRTRSGGRDGGEVRLAKMLTSLGHESVMAGWVAVRDGGFFAVPAADSPMPLRVDGAAIEGSFRRLHGGEVLGVGDAELEFVVER